MKEKKIKLLIFDLDSTLAPIGKGMGEEELQAFRAIDSLGIPIAVASGKTCDYLCGFLRQTGLREPIMIGENGAMIRFGVDLPPKQHYQVPISEEAVKSLKRIREILDENFSDLWYQPNLTQVTPFPKEEKSLDEIGKCISRYEKELTGIVIHRQSDCYDFVPAGMDKAVGISFLLDKMGLSWDHVMAIGDGVNDYGMFEKAAVALGVKVKEENRVEKNFTSTKEMLHYVLEYLS